MTRIATITTVALATAMGANAFTVNHVTKPSHSSTVKFMSDDPSGTDDLETTTERGVSIDQDGKSNVWAIEPKVEVEAKSTEEKATSAIVAGAGVAIFGVLAAGILTNLPDPNQF